MNRLSKVLIGLALAAGPILAQQPVVLTTGAAVVGAVTQSGTWNVTVNTALPAGTNVLGHVIVDTTSTTAVTQATAANLNATVVGAGTAGTPSGGVVSVQGVSSGTVIPVSFGPSSTSGGALTIKHFTTAAVANAKASAGNLYGYVLNNNGTNPCYLQLFNNASSPTIGTSVIDSIFVQAGVTVVSPPGSIALENFSTGIAFGGGTTDSSTGTAGCTSTFTGTLYFQ
jgi:hypothetical protein